MVLASLKVILANLFGEESLAVHILTQVCHSGGEGVTVTVRRDNGATMLLYREKERKNPQKRLAHDTSEGIWVTYVSHAISIPPAPAQWMSFSTFPTDLRCLHLDP